MARRAFQFQLDAWWRAFRAPAQINLILPLLLGLSQRTPCDATLDTLPLLPLFCLSLLLQAAILFSNEAADSATDDPASRTIISGGAGIGANGELSAQALRRAAVGAGLLGATACILLGGWPVFLLWLLAMCLVWAYDGETLRLSRHPLGALCQAVGVGVVLPLLAAWSVNTVALPAAVEVFMGLSLGVSGHLLTALPDEATDRRVGKQTLAVVLGPKCAFALLLGGLCVAALLLLYLPPGICTGVSVKSSIAGIETLILLCALIISAWWLHRRRNDYSPGIVGKVSEWTLAGLAVELWLAAAAALMLWSLWIAHYLPRL